MNKLDLLLLKVGYCDAYEHHAIKGGSRKKIAFDAIVGVIKHPEKGVILFDTGYSKRFYEETRTYPEKLYAQITKVYIQEQEELAHQLIQMGIQPNEIKHIIISHFHADHVAGLKDFPNATFYCSNKAYQQVKQKDGFSAVKKGLVKGLLPDDFDTRVQLIEESSEIEHPFFGKAHDLFGDGLIQLIDLSGHAAGQVGALLKTKDKDTFLVADACWLSKSYQELIFPNSIVRLFFDSWTAYKKNLTKLHHFHKAHPEIKIIPTHCNETTSSIISSQKLW